MSIRQATRDDVAAVVALERDLFGPDAWSLAAVTDELTGLGRHALVACTDDGSVVGYAVARVAGDVADLHRIAVAPTVRRTGLGRALLTELRRAARADGATRILLEVSARNEAALGLYAAEGFVEIDRRTRYYQDGTDALVLRGTVGAPACGGAR